VIIRSLDAVAGTDLDVMAPTWHSRRLLLAADGMGFSVHDTIIEAGTETVMWYRNHFEAVYCIAGCGSIEECATGAVHRVESGTMYALDQHDRHVLRAETQMRMICVFNPPCTGYEVHDADGSYPILTS
jgi:L-ectoine synthase